jgi:hypothetical protein
MISAVISAFVNVDWVTPLTNVSDVCDEVTIFLITLVFPVEN